MSLSKCEECGDRNSSFIKKRSSGILSNLGLKTSLDKISLLGNILFLMQYHWIQLWIWMK